MTDIKILQLFKKNLVDFFDELIGLFPTDGDLILMRSFIQHQAPTEILMKKFITSINKNDKKIRLLIQTKNDQIFTKHNMFFFCEENQTDNDPNLSHINQDSANHFKQLWTSGVLDKDDKNTIWAWLDRFVDLSDKYMAAVSVKDRSKSVK